MSELIVFCTPLQVYAELLEQEVAGKYTKMAIEDYDSLISFDETYMPFVETPDYEFVVGQKNGRNLLLTLFAQQPMIRVEDIENNFLYSSYLFNPESSDEDLLLPDLDIIQINGDSQVREAANTIRQFYENFGWRTSIFEGIITDRIEINPTSGRYNQPIEIIDPDVLREIAKEKVRYSITDLCF